MAYRSHRQVHPVPPRPKPVQHQPPPRPHAPVTQPTTTHATTHPTAVSPQHPTSTRDHVSTTAERPEPRHHEAEGRALLRGMSDWVKRGSGDPQAQHPEGAREADKPANEIAAANETAKPASEAAAVKPINETAAAQPATEAAGKPASEAAAATEAAVKPATEATAMHKSASEAAVQPAAEATVKPANETAAVQPAGRSAAVQPAAAEQPAPSSRPNPWGAKVERDAHGRPQDVTTTDGRKRHYDRFDDGSIRSMKLQGKDGKTLEWTRESADSNRWTARDENGRMRQQWRGDVDVNAEGVHSTRDAGKKDWTSYLPDGNTNGRGRIEDGQLSVQGKDGNTLYETHKDGSATYERNGSRRTVSQSGDLQSISTPTGERRIERENGKVSRVVEVDKQGNERELYSPGEGRTADVDNATGDVKISTADGRTQHRVDGTTVTQDKNGNPLSVQRPDGSSRTFQYDDGQVSAITDTRKTAKGDKSSTWTRMPGTDTFKSQDEKGRERPLRCDVKINEDGSYNYKDPKTGQSRTSQGPGASGGTGYVSDSVEDAHYNFLDNLGQQMSPERVKRMDGMMREFERRMGDRAYQRILAGQDPSAVHQDIEKTIAGTFDQLNEMVTTPKGQGEVYNQKMRTSLAENFMLHAADPTTYDQGYHGSCWMEAGTIANGWTNHTDHLARFVKEVSLTGQFHSEFANKGKGGTFGFRRDIFALPQGKEETRWSMENALRTNIRSPIGMILDEGQSSMLGRRSSWGGSYGETARTQYWITGDTPAQQPRNIRQTLLEKGAFINYWPGHMLTQQLRREGDHWEHIQDNQHGENSDYTIGRINDLSKWDYRADRRRGFQHFVPGSDVSDGPIGAYMPGPGVGPGSNPGYTASEGGPGPGPGQYRPGPSTIGGGGGGGGFVNPMVGANAGVPPGTSSADAMQLMMVLYALVQLMQNGEQGQNNPMIQAMLSGPNGPQLKTMLGMIQAAPGAMSQLQSAPALAAPPIA